METTMKIASGELSEELLFKIKQLFEGRAVTITISTEVDETEYLTASPTNRKNLLESMASEPSISFTPDEFERHFDKLLNKK